MSKSLTIKLAVVFVVITLVYSVFWFFKAGQLEKHINNFITENNSSVSASEVKVSGFPLAQKITIKDLKFIVPNPAFSKHQIIAKHVEAKSAIFGNEFEVELIEKPTTLDLENGSAGSIEFTQAPQIKFTVSNGMISHFSYQDLGYRMLDLDKNIIYSAISTIVKIESAIDSNEQITAKLNVNIGGIENFGILEVYKNSSEKRIMDAIKTGEIAIGNNAATDLTAASALPAVSVVAAQPTASGANVAAVAATSPVAAGVANVASNMLAPTKKEGAQPEIAASATDVSALVATSQEESIKSNLIAEFEYIFTPVKAEQKANVPLDPSQLAQESNLQYNKSLKINNLEFSNSLYKIAINGQVNFFQDDNMPSGFITVKADNATALVNYLAKGFVKMADKKQADATAVQTADLATATQPTAQVSAYQNFLRKIAAGLPSVSLELAAKNQLSKDNSEVFDIRREKNLEFVINETPLREVVGKF